MVQAVATAVHLVNKKMLNLRTTLSRIKNTRRHISALYITGDKANENYVTLQPFLDFEETFRERTELKQSIAKRGLDVNLDAVLSKYHKYQSHQRELHRLDEERESVTKRLKVLAKSGHEVDEAVMQRLKERGKTLRNDVKILKQTIYPIEDDFIHDFLNLPNLLHSQCPSGQEETLLYRHALPENFQKKGPSHLEREDLIHFVDNNRYYMMDQAAHFDVNAMQALARYFVTKGDFIQTANPDFVRCVLLEANATPLEHYHLVKEEHLQNKLNTAFLTGGGSFESYLGAMTKLSVYPSVLPLRYVCCGRSYSRAESHQSGSVSSLYTATQTNAVQCFIATQTANQADEQLEHVLNLAIDFYKALDVPFRIVYAPATSLTSAESLRAVIEMYAPSLQQYVSVGRISNYGNYVSKRILFSTRRGKEYDFLHLIGGPLLYTSRLIAALLEHGIQLDNCRLLGSANSQLKTTTLQNDIQQFKELFK